LAPEEESVHVACGFFHGPDAETNHAIGEIEHATFAPTPTTRGVSRHSIEHVHGGKKQFEKIDHGLGPYGEIYSEIHCAKHQCHTIVRETCLYCTCWIPLDDG
jgi:hypothetical protein